MQATLMSSTPLFRQEILQILVDAFFSFRDFYHHLDFLLCIYSLLKEICCFSLFKRETGEK